MNTTSTTGGAADAGTRSILRMAGISAIAIAIGYVATIPIYAAVGDQPATGVGAQLAYFGDHAAGWWSIAAVMVITDLLYIPVFIGLYSALQHVNRGLMLVSSAFAALLFVILDLAVTWTSYSTMIVAGTQYAGAGESERAALVAAAAYPAAILRDNPVLGTYAILIPSMGILIAGLVMLQGVLGRATAYLALATGLTGILFMGSYLIEGLAALRYLNAILALLFYLVAGIRLFRLGRG